MWVLKKKTQMDFFTKQTQKHRKQTDGYQGGGGEGWIRNLELKYVYNYIHIIDNHQRPTVYIQHRDYTQYLIITYNGREYKKRIYRHTYICTHAHIYI